MTISDAELTAMYGRGLHPDTAARVIDEVRALRFRLAETEDLAEAMEGDRDTWRHRAEVISGKHDTLRARLAEAEVKQDEYVVRLKEVINAAGELRARLGDYRRFAGGCGVSEIDTAAIRVRAADDRGAPYHPDVEGWEIVALCDEVDRLRARLAEVEALCKDPNRQRYATAPHNQGWFDGRESAFAEVLAAARGEGDQ